MVAMPSDGGQRQAGFGRKTMAGDTPIVAAVRIKASLIPVSVLGHPIFNANPRAFRLQPQSLGDAMYVARCQHLAIGRLTPFGKRRKIKLWEHAPRLATCINLQLPGSDS